MSNRKIEAGPAIPVVVIDDLSGGGGGGTLDVSDAALLSALQQSSSELLTELQNKADLSDVQPVKKHYALLKSTDVAAPAANSAATVTYTGTTGVHDVVGQITWSYSADPTGGLLTIKEGSTVVFSTQITKGGPGQLTFDPPVTVTDGQNLVVTLSAGGSGISGQVSVTHWTEA